MGRNAIGLGEELSEACCQTALNELNEVPPPYPLPEVTTAAHGGEVLSKAVQPGMWRNHHRRSRPQTLDFKDRILQKLGPVENCQLYFWQDKRHF